MSTLYKAMTRPAMYVGVPVVPLTVVAGALFLAGVYISKLIWLAIPVAVFILRMITKQDDHIFNLYFLRGPLGKRKISHAKTIFYTVTVCCFALTLRIVCRVVRNSLAIALILAPDLMRSSTFCVCSSFNTGGRPKRFPASRALAIPE